MLAVSRPQRSIPQRSNASRVSTRLLFTDPLRGTTPLRLRCAPPTPTVVRSSFYSNTGMRAGRIAGERLESAEEERPAQLTLGVGS